MRRSLLPLCSVSLILAACSGDAENDGSSSGSETGGATGAGGFVATGGDGTSSSGGAFASGGQAATGGGTFGSGGFVPASGGALGTGGLSETGGSPATGGAAATGGSTATGGVAATGGGTATGGVAATGGVSATGGTATTGGTSGTGGAASSDVPSIAQCAAYSDWSDEARELEQDVLDIVNQHRLAGTDCDTAKSPVGALTMDPLLRCAARIHAQDMADRDFFSHGTWNDSAPVCTDKDDCSNGQLCDNKLGESTPLRCLNGPSTRLASLAYAGGAWGENIAAGSGTAAQVMNNQWMTSSGHCNNIMNGNYTKIGVAYVEGGPYGTMWVQVFGK